MDAGDYRAIDSYNREIQELQEKIRQYELNPPNWSNSNDVDRAISEMRMKVLTIQGRIRDIQTDYRD